MIKRIIKKLISPKRIKKVRQFYLYCRACTKKRIVTKIDYKIFSQQNRHVFFGYYDLKQFDRNDSKILVHSIPKNAIAGKDKADIGYFDLQDNSFHKLSDTMAWSWQQGARLRWHPKNDMQILFNDVENGKYVCRLYDLSTKKVEITFDSAFYDIDQNFTFGLCLDFSRLQRLRPGYGYSNLPEDSEDVGIEMYDLHSHIKKPIIHLYDLKKDILDYELYEHYINHISISPSGKRFIFFHLMSPKQGGHWVNRLIVYDFNEIRQIVLEDKHIVSHYCWKSDEQVLVTCVDKDNHEFYCLYDIDQHRKTIVGKNILTRDGHPTYMNDQIISDTYPDRDSYQQLFVYSENEPQRILLKAFHNPFLCGEKRCDFHPRLSDSQKCVCIDTTAYGDRSCCVLYLNT